MKKSNLKTLIIFTIMIAAIILFMCFRKAPAKTVNTQPVTNATHSDNVSNPNHIETDTLKFSDATKSGSKTNKTSKNRTLKMSDALFIGDSRTVGLSEYGSIHNADFFCNVGMSIYNIYNDTLSVPTVGKVTLTELLTSKKYGKIYIMLGVNELGYNFDNTLGKYMELISFIQKNQPEALIFIQANLHVTQSRSDNDTVVNNRAINRFNNALSDLANNKTSFYLDVNTMFDDTSGSLSSDKSEDDTHLYAKYYAQWGRWIIQQTMTYMGRNSLD